MITDPEQIRIYKQIYIDGVRDGYALCREDYGDLKPNITQNKARKQYTKAKLEQWEKMGLITPHKDGDCINSPIYYSRVELEAANRSGLLSRALDQRTEVKKI